MLVAGVDACRNGWVAVVNRDGVFAAYVISHIAELNEVVPGAQVVAIDIPIGLLSEGIRTADLMGRDELDTRRSTLFVVPVRSALEAMTHHEATSISSEKSGVGISLQSFSLKEKIFEVERWLPDAPCPVYEVHPELSFKEMDGTVVTPSKKTWAGMTVRRDKLFREQIFLDGVSLEVGARCATDDMLDAGAAVWSARRILMKGARSIPAQPQRSPEGRDIAIWI
jgi:predicted RNase H-like nuclease